MIPQVSNSMASSFFKLLKGCRYCPNRISLANLNNSTVTSATRPIVNSDGKIIYPTQEVVRDIPKLSVSDNKMALDTIVKINQQIQEKQHGRLFVVVRIFGKQYKVTTEDIIILNNEFVPKIGEHVHLNKVLLVGGSDFTLLGRPLLSNNLVQVHATVIEKTLSRALLRFHFIKRKNHKRKRFYRSPLTMLRINSIEITETMEYESS